MPIIGDEVAPWLYRGWLLHHIQLCHGHPQVVDRWGYYFRTHAAGKLLDEPIPRIHFGGCRENDEAMKMLRSCVDLIYRDTGSWSAFPEFIDWLSWGCATSRECPKRISEKTNEALYRTFNLGPLLLNPSDHLGTLYSEGKERYNPAAFYPTPHEVVEMMSLMLMDHTPAGGTDLRLKSVCDPCVGTGRMLMHASNYSLILMGMDIDATCCKITQINGAMYVPWMTFPLPASITGKILPPVSPVPEAGPSSTPTPEKFRVDNRGQGLLFS